MTHVTWHMICDTWYVKHDTWHMTQDTLLNLNIVSKLFSLFLFYFLNVTPDTWHMTHNMWHMTRDTRHVTLCGMWTVSQHFSSQALTLCDFWCFEDWKEKRWVTELSNELINQEGVCGTAPATLGLLVILLHRCFRHCGWVSSHLPVTKSGPRTCMDRQNYSFILEFAHSFCMSYCSGKLKM